MVKTLPRWKRAQFGWYRTHTEDGGLWLHVIKRHGEWALCVNTDQYEVSVLQQKYCGYLTKGEAQAVAAHIYGSYKSAIDKLRKELLATPPNQPAEEERG